MNKQELKAKLIEEMRTMDETARKENRSFTEEENKAFADKEAEVRRLTAEIEAEERSAKLNGFTTEKPKTEEKSSEKKDVLFRSEKVGGVMELRTNMTMADGGAAIAPEKFVEELEKDVAKEAVVYARVKKVPVTGAGSLGLPYESADASDADWTQEVPASEINADATWAFGKRSLSPTDLTKLVKISRKLLATSAFPIDTLAREKIAEKLTAAFENGILNGTGTDEPLGLFTASADGIPATRDVATAGATLTADDFMEAYMSLRPAYRRNACWVMNTAVLKDVMKLKDKNDQYIWQESLRVGEPSTILGLPVIESEYAPSAKTAGSYVAVLGDLSHYQFAYWKGLDITIADQVFAGKNQVGFYGHTLADGCPTLPNAFARLKIKE